MFLDLIRVFADNLLPIFLATSLGYLAGAVLHLEGRSLALLGFNVFGPCLVFQLVTGAGLGTGEIARMVLVCAGALLGTAALAWLVGRLLRLPRRQHAALVMVALLPNAGNYGLSLTKLAFGEQALAHAGVFFVASSVILYTVGVLVASMGRTEAREAVIGLSKVPAIYAVLIALLVVYIDLSIPAPVERTVSLLADAAIPVFLVVLGLQLHRSGSFQLSQALAAGVLLRLVASPIIALALVAALDMAGPARQAGLIEAAMPTAVATTVLAETYEVESGFVTAAVLASTLLSPITLTPLLVWLGAG